MSPLLSNHLLPVHCTLYHLLPQLDFHSCFHYYPGNNQRIIYYCAAKNSSNSIHIISHSHKKFSSFKPVWSTHDLCMLKCCIQPTGYCCIEQTDYNNLRCEYKLLVANANCNIMLLTCTFFILLYVTSQNFEL